MCRELRTPLSRNFGQKQTVTNPVIKFLVCYRSYGLACLLLRISTGGKNEQEEVDSLGVVFGRLSLGRMRNGSWHGGRYTEPWERIEKNGIRIGCLMSRRAKSGLGKQAFNARLVNVA